MPCWTPRPQRLGVMPLLLPPDECRNEPFTPTRRGRAPPPEGRRGAPIGRLRGPVPRSGRQPPVPPHHERTGPRPTGHAAAPAPRPARGEERGQCLNSDSNKRFTGSGTADTGGVGPGGGSGLGRAERPADGVRPAGVRRVLPPAARAGVRLRAFNGPAHRMRSAVTEFEENDALSFVCHPKGPVVARRVSALVEGVLPCTGFPSVNVVKGVSSPSEHACTQR